MKHMQLSFVREGMMTALLIWRRSLQTRLSLGINNFMQTKRVLLMQMRQKRAQFMGQGYFFEV